MARRPVQAHHLYTRHELESGVIAPFSECGRDAATGAVAPVVNPGQGVASPRGLAAESLGHTLDIDTSFAFENVNNKQCEHINILETGVAVRFRMLPNIVRCFESRRGDYPNLLTGLGIDFIPKNNRLRCLAKDFILEKTLYDLNSFDFMTSDHTRSEFKSDIENIKSSRQHRLGSRVEGYISAEYARIQRLNELLRTAKTVVKAIRELHSSVDAGQTPDLVTVERIVQTPQTYDEMPRLLCEAAFHGMVDPTRIFLDFAAHAELLQVPMFLGQANFGLIAPTKRQATAFLYELVEDPVAIHRPMRALILNQIEAICDWRPHREIIATICRQVIDGARQEGTPERRQLWKIR